MSDTKPCTKCGRVLPLSEFHKEKRMLLGRRSECKRCFGAAQKARHEANRDRHLLYARAWYLANRERILAKEAARRREDREFVRASTKRAADRRLARRKEHPERHRAHDLVKKAVGRGRLLRPEACQECGRVGRVEGHHHDYTKPLAVQWLCKRCHSALHSRYEGLTPRASIEAQP